VRLKNIYGRYVNKNVEKYRIDWEEKSRSKAQFRTKEFLKQYWQNDIVYEEFPVYGTRMKVDIVNMTKKIAIEVQGNQHYSFNKHFHKNSRLKYLASLKRDVKKIEWLELNDFLVAEITEDETKSLSRKFFEESFGINLY
jgi:hypothetical protein